MIIIETILSYLKATDLTQWLAFVFNLAYVFLAARTNQWCWFWGFWGCLCQGIVCIDANLKSDAILQTYFAGSAIYGWFSWRERADGSQLPVSSPPLSMHLKFVLIGVLFALPLGYFWHTAAFRYEDALLTSFSILTTFLTARKILESWFYWLIIDGMYAVIYYERDKVLLAILALVYFFFSIRGYLSWRKSYGL